MIELPEAVTLAAEVAESTAERRVRSAVAARTPHKWAWYHGDPAGYDALLRGRTIRGAASYGGFVDVELDGARLLFGEGVSLRYRGAGAPRPDRHQLLVELEDGTALVGTVQMYGGLWAYGDEEIDNPYVAAAKAAPSPLDEGFDRAYFERIIGAADVQKQSAKALLATEQRVPGLGNGVLQDILFEARVHPRRKVATLNEDERMALFGAVRSTLAEMTRLGGRDTERDLYGRPGGYATKLSRNTVGNPCPRCGATIEKMPYLGGAVYYCGTCQRL